MAQAPHLPIESSYTKGLWVRYGGQDITDEQIKFAAEHYSVALLQPDDEAAAARLKELRPSMVVLCYKCLSSTRNYESPGKYITSGVSYREAEEAEKAGGKWFARRLNGEKIEWKGYGGHFQMAVWNPEYRARWIENVCAMLKDSPFDGVMADNDIHGDYYGLNLPIQDAKELKVFHDALERLVIDAGTALNKMDKILVPNIAESRENPGKWERHSAYGGGFEEVFLGWAVDTYLDFSATRAMIAQMPPEFKRVQLASKWVPRLTLLRASTDGSDRHYGFTGALAAFWVFGGGQWTAISAGGIDAHNDTPWIEEQGWDLGHPMGEIQFVNGTYVREFSAGWAAANISGSRSGKVSIPSGYVDYQGRSLSSIYLDGHHGVVLRKPE